jgi:hypothetical protein
LLEIEVVKVDIVLEVVVDEDVGVILVLAVVDFLKSEFSSALLFDRLVCSLGAVETIELDLGLRNCLCCCCCLSREVLIVKCFFISSSEFSVRLRRCLLAVVVDVDVELAVEVVLVTVAGKGIRVGVFATVREEDAEGL